MSDVYLYSAERLLAELSAKIEAKNAKDHSFIRSVASGFAFKHETDKQDYNQAYLLADERMYMNKEMMHNNAQ